MTVSTIQTKSELDATSVACDGAAFTSEHDGWVRSAAFPAYLGAVLWFCVWRVSTLLNATGKVALLGLFSLAFEIPLILSSTRRMRQLGKLENRSREADEQQGWWHGQATPPLVDVLIPTYDESPAILERTILGAQRQAYPNHRIWILDDGQRPDVRELAERLGALYSARPERSYAKAGNLNEALKRLAFVVPRSDFVAVLDADSIVLPEFVARTLSLMKDPTVALVQTSVAFFNDDAFQRALMSDRRLPDALRFPFDTIQPSLDACGTGNCLGSAFLARTCALFAIDGMQTSAVTEDLLTGLKLRETGWKVRYLNEHLSFGCATEGLSEYRIQRARWTCGFVQLALQAMSSKNVSWLRRLGSAESWLRGLYVPIFTWWFAILPIFFWWLDAAPVSGSTNAVLAYAAPMVVLHRWLLYRISKGGLLPIYGEAISLVQAFVAVPAAYRELWRARRGGATEFVVTPKEQKKTSRTIHAVPLVAALSGLILLVGGALGAAIGVLPAGRSGLAPLYYLWTAYLCLVLGTLLTFSIELPRLRGETRLPARTLDSVDIETGEGRYQAVVCEASSSSLVVRLPGIALAAGQATRIGGADLDLMDATVVRGLGDRRWALRLGSGEGKGRRCWFDRIHSRAFLALTARPHWSGVWVGLFKRVLFELRHVDRLARSKL